MHQCLKLGVISVAGLLLSSVMSAALTAHASKSARAAATVAQTSPLDQVWQPASPDEEARFWDYVLNSPLGIAALNQLAIEDFVSPLCERSLYTHAEFGSFQILLQVECPDPQGISIARAYDEVRVVFNRFEDNIESFEIERIYVEN